jgi:hypothetical protein
MAETLNGRWQNTVIKLVDPNQGTREAAANALYNMAQSQGIDLRDFELRKKSGAARRPASRDPAHFQLVAENLRLQAELLDAKLEVGRREYKLLEQQEEIERLQASNYEMNTGTARQIAALNKTLAERDAEIARLTREKANHTYEAPAEDRAETQVEEDDMARPERDVWQTKIEKYLKRYSVDRISTFELLEECIGLSAAEQTTDVGRRISRIMFHIGGWKSSTNINFEGTICRGYIKMTPDELERLKTKHVGPHGEWRPPSAKRK